MIYLADYIIHPVKIVLSLLYFISFFLGSQAKVLGKKQHACKLQKGNLESV